MGEELSIVERALSGESVRVVLLPRASLRRGERVEVESYLLPFLVVHPGIGVFGSFGAVHDPYQMFTVFGNPGLAGAAAASSAYGYSSFANVVLNWSAQFPKIRVFTASRYGQLVFRTTKDFEKVWSTEGDWTLERIHERAMQGMRFKCAIHADGLVHIQPVHTMDVMENDFRLSTDFDSIPALAKDPSTLVDIGRSVDSLLASRSPTLPAEENLKIEHHVDGHQITTHFVITRTACTHFEFGSGAGYEIRPERIDIFAETGDSVESAVHEPLSFA